MLFLVLFALFGLLLQNIYKKYFVILHLPNNKGVRQTMRKYLKWLLPEIFIASCYSLTPFIVFTPILAALSHILSTSEQGVYTFLRTGLVVWVVLLLFLSLKKLNDYGFMKTVLVAIIALAFMVIILAVVILLVSLTAQLITFFTGLWEEIDLKYIH